MRFDSSSSSSSSGGGGVSWAGASPEDFPTVTAAPSHPKARIPLRRLPRNFPVRRSFGEVGVVEFGLIP